jgi:hypothetical protein
LKVYEKAIAKWGKSLQLTMAIEEMAELTKELTKDLRNLGDKPHIIEEIADVEIMLEQLKIIYKCSSPLEETKKIKLARLEDRIDNG